MRAELRGNMCGARAGLKVRAAARVALLVFVACVAPAASGQESVPPDEAEFGPVVRAYLGYLRAEQEVTDDRASRREVSPAYVRRNSNRIRALRVTAVRIARETGNDYLPELYAVARDELGTLFETPPRPVTFRAGEVLNRTFRFLGAVRAGEVFYLFARLDIYEQAELLKKAGDDEQQQRARATQPGGGNAPGGSTQGSDVQSGSTQSVPATRPRRVPPPGTDPQSPPPPFEQR